MLFEGKINNDVEGEAKEDPESGKEGCFTEADGMGVFVEDFEVEEEEYGDEEEKT